MSQKSCAWCTKSNSKPYILCRNPHLTKRRESGRIFKVARAAADIADKLEVDRKKSKIFEKSFEKPIDKAKVL